MKFPKLCLPAMIYFVISIIVLVMNFYSKHNIMILILKLFSTFIWSWILNLLCKKGLGILSWIFIVLPFAIMMYYKI